MVSAWAPDWDLRFTKCKGFKLSKSRGPTDRRRYSLRHVSYSSPSFLMRDSRPPSTGSISMGRFSRLGTAGGGGAGATGSSGFAAVRGDGDAGMFTPCAGSVSGLSSAAGKYHVFLFSSQV